MEKHLPILRRQDVFRGMADAEILRLLACLNAREARFDRARSLWELGGARWAVVVTGGLMALLADPRGNRTIVGDYGPGELLDGGAMESDVLPLSFDVRAGTLLLLLDAAAAAAPCARACRAHLLFLRNAAQAYGRREKLLLYKVEYLSKRSTREKIIRYLELQTDLQGSRKLSIPYSRQELADFLAVDRSAMCAELTRMQHDGLIRFERKRFEVLRMESHNL
ncbi:MAG: helix-turn-helix domain-containing protein [Oscillospiraceae bacterium]|nr:helix-turn-helix domain-containing protein [Oscillospiraceae bacterium]MCL1951531.1 helix-turn-helix domain-containing protein [Oscillospiraceae bacterium]